MRIVLGLMQKKAEKLCFSAFLRGRHWSPLPIYATFVVLLGTPRTSSPTGLIVIPNLSSVGEEFAAPVYDNPSVIFLRKCHLPLHKGGACLVLTLLFGVTFIDCRGRRPRRPVPLIKHHSPPITLFLLIQKAQKKKLSKKKTPVKRISLVATSDRRFAGGSRQAF